MIYNRIQGDYQNWDQVPVSPQAEVLSSQASLTFSASTSLSEKVQRVFNGIMFAIVGAAIINKIAFIASGYSLSSMRFAAISSASLLQIPTVAAIIALAPKVILTLAIVLVVRKILAVAICHFVYPAVIMTYSEDKQALDQNREILFHALTQEHYESRRLALSKSGINYDAFVFEHEDTKGNGQWVLVAGGNGWVGEHCAGQSVRRFHGLGFNTLYVNGPGVGRSSGFPTSYSIGAGQEAGLQFLETAVNAKKILLYGQSLGGGAQAEAIRMHKFKMDSIDYMVWSDRSFDTLSNTASSMVTILAKPIFWLLGIELNGVEGAKKLKQLGITHIVTQNSHIIGDNAALPLDQESDADKNETDSVIPNRASLYNGLKKAGIIDSDRVKCYGGPTVDHNANLPVKITDFVRQDIEDFLQGAVEMA
jgi:hypothetical protein